MTETKAAALTDVAPFFIVSNYAAVRDFYTDKLGFGIELELPEDEQPWFGIVARDAVSIFLKEIGPDVQPQPNHTRHEWARWDAFVHTPDPDLLYAEFAGQGVTFHEDLADTDDGLRGFTIYDSDRYTIFFGC